MVVLSFDSQTFVPLNKRKHYAGVSLLRVAPKMDSVFSFEALKTGTLEEGHTCVTKGHGCLISDTPRSPSLLVLRF